MQRNTRSKSPSKHNSDNFEGQLNLKKIVLRKREQRSTTMQGKNYQNFYKRLDDGLDSGTAQGQRKQSIDSDNIKKPKDRKKRKSKPIKKNKTQLRTLSRKSILQLSKISAKKNKMNQSDEFKNVKSVKESASNFASDKLLNSNGFAEKQEIVLQSSGPIQLEASAININNFFEVIKYYNANRTVKCSERIYEEGLDFLEATFLKQNQSLGLKNQKFDLDAVDLPFPEQPKTKVIAEEILQQQELEQLQQKQINGQQVALLDEAAQHSLKSETFINCDLRFFNLQYLVDQIGHFEVVQIDPPWRIKGAQRNNTSFMFSNNKFNLDYSTMSNAEIMNIPVEVLSRKGFCFLWILNSQMHIGYECMNKWGYEVVDQLTWIKTKNKKIHISHGFYFLHSSEVCLVGYKCPPNEYIEFKSKVSNNLIVAEIRKKSQKPEQIYTLIDILIPGAKKIELFARNNNLRRGWLSLGNQLGENYVNWKNVVICDDCNKDITTGNRYYKSKLKANYDICEKCFTVKQTNYANKQGFIDESQHGYKASKNQYLERFYLIENATDEDILHEYHQCNICNAEPIWGLRFKCSSCEDCDLNGHNKDKEDIIQVKPDDIICREHDFMCIELPLIADGLAAHNQYKCVSCYMRPIIGACFVCADCNHFSLCQNCYFTRPFQNLKVRGHTPNHHIELIVEPRQTVKKYVKCNGCGEMPIQDVRYKCNNCFDFDFCEKCYQLYCVEKKELKTVYSTSHKGYHTFTRLMLASSNAVANNTKDQNQGELLEDGETQTKGKSNRNRKVQSQIATTQEGVKIKRPPGRPAGKSKSKKQINQDSQL
eukprot:403348598